MKRISERIKLHMIDDIFRYKGNPIFVTEFKHPLFHLFHKLPQKNMSECLEQKNCDYNCV